MRIQPSGGHPLIAAVEEREQAFAGGGCGRDDAVVVFSALFNGRHFVAGVRHVRDQVDGKELELFDLDPFDVGKGLPLRLPRGAAIIEELEKLAKETEVAAGYQRVRTPHIGREALYRRSGHLPYYADSMFPYMQTKPEEEDAKKLSQIEANVAQVERASRELQSTAEQAEKNAAFRKQIMDMLSSVEHAFDTLGKHFIEREDVAQHVGGLRNNIITIIKELYKTGKLHAKLIME